MAKENKDTLKEETKKTQKADKKSKKNEKNEEKKGFARVVKWFKELKIEFKNVTWPKKKTVLINTSIVMTTIIISSVVVGLLDTGMLELLKFLIGLSQ